MIYPILKEIIESLVKSHKCKECDSWIRDEDIEIHSVKNGNIIMTITCPSCKNSVSIKAQVKHVEDTLGWGVWIIQKKEFDIQTLKDEIDSASAIEDLLK